MIPRTNPPRLSQEAPNYAILNLNGGYSDIHVSWRRCVLDFRHWCYNNSHNRYDYGGADKRSCEAPGSGHFCIYTTYDDKWMCSIVDGATLYMNGHITRSLGPTREERRICENKPDDGKTHLIEDSEFMEWDGSYIKEPVPVGAGALISSFTPLYKHAEGEKMPLKVLRRAGQIYFLHFPEAARFDSLCLDIIDKNFIAGGIVQVTDIERHQNWSADCKDIRAEIAKPAPQTDKETEQRAKVLLMIKDIRVMHKLGVRDGAFKLENMPFQLDENGRVQDPMATESDPFHDPLAIVPAGRGGEGGRGGGEGGDGGRGAGRGGRERGDRGPRRGRRKGPLGQNAEQQNTDNTNPDFLIERFGNFAKITEFHLEVSDATKNQLYDLVLTSNPVRVFRSLLLQHNCRIRSTPTQLNSKDTTTGDNLKLNETPQREITKFHLEVSDAIKNQLCDLVLTSNSVRVFVSLLLQHNYRIRSTPTQLNGKDITPGDNQKLIETPREIQAAFRTDKIPQASPHDEMHAGMSHFHCIKGKGVPKFLKRVYAAPKKQVSYDQFIQCPYLMGEGDPRATPAVTRDICLLAGMLNVNLCSTEIENLMFELCMWRHVHELSAKADQHQSTRKGTAKHFTELWTRFPRGEPFPDCPEEFNGKMACQGPYLSTKLTAGLLAH